MIIVALFDWEENPKSFEECPPNLSADVDVLELLLNIDPSNREVPIPELEIDSSIGQASFNEEENLITSQMIEQTEAEEVAHTSQNSMLPPQFPTSTSKIAQRVVSSSTTSSNGRKRKANSSNVDSDYLIKRERNNVAVRKSREKSRRRQNETEEAMHKLSNENKDLRHKLDVAYKELQFLKSLFLNIGQTVPVELRDALRQKAELFTDE